MTQNFVHLVQILVMEDFSYDSEHYKLHFKDGIFFGTYIGGPITLGLAKEIVRKRLELTGGEEVLAIANIEEVNGIDRDARNYLSSAEGTKGITAGAIITDSAFTKHLANFFMKIPFSKSLIPGKVFSNEEEAILWLKKFG
ncbi:MAG: hypothetical protein ACI8ZM_002610 [Crocinitomix sp.]|jgi:hypothetical protein